MSTNRPSSPSTQPAKASRASTRPITHVAASRGTDEVARLEAALADALGTSEALDKSMAVIEFDLDGTVLTANANFLAAMGYSLPEIQGRHHSMFVDAAYRASPAYTEFWAKLNRGEFDAAEYKRIGKGGREVWIQASYNPVRDRHGKVTKVIKFASDITQQSLKMADYSGQVAAIGMSNAVIEFSLDGTILTANDNFLSLLGYTLDEVQGRHHSMFVDEGERAGQGYRDFWAKLNRGEFHSGEYKRLGKGGKVCFIQATYNPIRNRDGSLMKVVKYATDSTALVQMRHEMALIKAMVESATLNILLCDLEGRIKYANPASVATLTRIEAHIPIKASQVIGSTIDFFHKDAAHQRALIANDKNLPTTTRVALGPETLEITSVAIYDADGVYVGPMINWTVVTEQVRLADDFEASVAAIASVVSSSSTELEASAQGMAASSEETTRQAQAVAAASEQATRNVQTVASSAEELTASIREIAGRVQEASQISQVAVKQASDTTETMAKLACRARRSARW